MQTCVDEGVGVHVQVFFVHVPCCIRPLPTPPAATRLGQGPHPAQDTAPTPPCSGIRAQRRRGAPAGDHALPSLIGMEPLAFSSVFLAVLRSCGFPLTGPKACGAARLGVRCVASRWCHGRGKGAPGAAQLRSSHSVRQTSSSAQPSRSTCRHSLHTRSHMHTFAGHLRADTTTGRSSGTTTPRGPPVACADAPDTDMSTGHPAGIAATHFNRPGLPRLQNRFSELLGSTWGCTRGTAHADRRAFKPAGTHRRGGACRGFSSGEALGSTRTIAPSGRGCVRKKRGKGHRVKNCKRGRVGGLTWALMCAGRTDTG